MISSNLSSNLNFNCLNINTLEKLFYSSSNKFKINKSELNTISLNSIILKLGLSDDLIVKINNKSYNMSRLFLLCSDYFDNTINDKNIFNIKFIKINFNILNNLSFIQRLNLNNIDLLLNDFENIFIFYLNNDDLDENNYNTLINIGFVKDIKFFF